MRGIHRWSLNFPHKLPVTRNFFFEKWYPTGVCFTFEYPVRVYTWGERRHIPTIWQTDCQCPKSIISNIYYIMMISVVRSTVFHNTLLIFVASSFAPLLICACLSRDRYEFPVLSCTPGWPKYRTLTLWYKFHASRQASEQAAYISDADTVKYNKSIDLNSYGSSYGSIRIQIYAFIVGGPRSIFHVSMLYVIC